MRSFPKAPSPEGEWPSALLDHLADERIKPRNDEIFGHVSDLYGCNRKTWYRRHGIEPDYHFTDAEFAMFSLGFAYEERIAKELRDSGLEVVTGKQVYIPRGSTGYISDRQDHDGITGHPDIFLPEWGLLLDTKTKHAWQVAEEADESNAFQVATYALATGMKRAGLLVAYLRFYSKKKPTKATPEPPAPTPEIVYSVDPEPYRERVVQRVGEVLDLTRPDATELPPPTPYPEGAAWACSYCQYRDRCEKQNLSDSLNASLAARTPSYEELVAMSDEIR